MQKCSNRNLLILLSSNNFCYEISLKCHPTPGPPWGNGARRRMTFQTTMKYMAVASRREGGGISCPHSQKMSHWRILETQVVLELLGSFRYRVIWLLLKNHHLDQLHVRTWNGFRKRQFRASTFQKFLGQHARSPQRLTSPALVLLASPHTNF